MNGTLGRVSGQDITRHISVFVDDVRNPKNHASATTSSPLAELNNVASFQGGRPPAPIKAPRRMTLDTHAELLCSLATCASNKENTRPPMPIHQSRPPVHQAPSYTVTTQENRPPGRPPLAGARLVQTERKAGSAFRKVQPLKTKTPGVYPPIYYRNLTVKTMGASKVRSFPTSVKMVLSCRFA